MRYEQIKSLKDADFKRLTGVRRSTFEKMLEVVTEGRREFGRPPSLSRADELLMTLMYWREYRTQFHSGVTYGVSEATVCRVIQKVEKALIKSKQFHLPGKKVLQASDRNWCLDWRDHFWPLAPQRQRQHYSGKKRDTQAQVIVNQRTEEIGNRLWAGSKHDSIVQESRSALSVTICSLADSGYQGLTNVHEHGTACNLPAEEQKASNRALSRQRIRVENVIGRLKVLRILCERYRNRRKRFALRFNLIAAICNLELKAA
jgi:hypothetical protein